MLSGITCVGESGGGATGGCAAASFMAVLAATRAACACAALTGSGVFPMRSNDFVTKLLIRESAM